jgi:thiosulfate dehydrogenase
MRAFVLGVIVTIIVLIAGGLLAARLGYLPTSADATPSALERHIAMQALDASMDRDAPRINNPFPETPDNLIAGAKVYTMNCSVCHGTMDYKPSVLEHSIYPSPPQLLLDPLDDPEWHIYYAIRTGVRYTGMPAWNKALSDEDMWNLTAFLSHLEHPPPEVQDYWKKAYGVTPRAHEPEQHGAHEHQE